MLTAAHDVPTAGLDWTTRLIIASPDGSTRDVPLPARAGFRNGASAAGRACLFDDLRAAFQANTDQAGFGNGLQTIWFDGSRTRTIDFAETDGDAGNGNGKTVRGYSSDARVLGSTLMGFEGAQLWTVDGGFTSVPLVGAAPVVAVNASGDLLAATGRRVGGAVTPPPNAADLGLVTGYVDINDSGLVVGHASGTRNGLAYSQLVRWPAGQPAQRVESPAGMDVVTAIDVNNRGDVLVRGEANGVSGSTWWVHWANGSWDRIVTADRPVDQVRAINDRGSVLGTTSLNGTANRVVVLRR